MARASNASFRRGTTSSRLTLSQDENKCRTYHRLSALQGSDECIGAPCCHFRASRTHRASRRRKRTRAYGFAVRSGRNRQGSAGRRIGFWRSARDRRRWQRRRRWRGRGTLRCRYCRAHGGQGSVVRYPARSFRACDRTGRPASGTGNLCRSRRRKIRSRLFRRGSSRRFWRCRCRDCTAFDDGLTAASACRRKLRRHRHRHSPLASADGGNGFWPANRLRNPLAGVGPAVDTIARSGDWTGALAS